MRSQWKYFARAFGFVLTIPLASVAVAQTSPRASSTPVRPEMFAGEWRGTGSCAAIACHGGRREPLGLKGSEYSFWASYDPHDNAYRVLYDERSKRVEMNLRKTASLELAKPEQDALCLSCHVHPGFDDAMVASQDEMLYDGVGCESCHGPAGRWLSAHIDAGWSSIPDSDKAGLFGFVPTKDLATRGMVCTNCHVGKGLGDVNHDLIAAGHPRLLFEFAGQLAKLPKHWRIEDDRARNPDHEVKAWLVGQAVNAMASLDLLADRAESAAAKSGGAPWPEFTEFDCYACHHDLAKPSWRQDRLDLAVKEPGTLPWGAWSLPTSARIAKSWSNLDIKSPETNLGKLQALMARPDPDPAAAAKLARAASVELEGWLRAIEGRQVSRAEVRSLLSTVLDVIPENKTLDWNNAAQTYLGAVSLRTALADMGGPARSDRVLESFNTIYRDLNLPKRSKKTGEELVDSPLRYDPVKMRSELRTLRDFLLSEEAAP